MSKILVVVGPSCVGKTTVVKEILRSLAGSKLITSLTTRQSRSNDLPGEYQNNISSRRLRRMQKVGKLAWLVDRKDGHGNMYATTIASLEDALKYEGLSVMILVPKTVRKLIKIVGRENIIPVFIFVKNPSTIKNRSVLRGDPLEDQIRRFKDCRLWLRNARRSRVGYEFIDNSGSVENSLAQILNILQGKLKIADFESFEVEDMKWEDDGGSVL